jgi:lipoate synthase
VVITSDNRDERKVCGSPNLCMVIRRIRRFSRAAASKSDPGLQGQRGRPSDREGAQRNPEPQVETVPCLFARPAPGSLRMGMTTGATQTDGPLVLTKSGNLVGLGET